ncbi:hypothetical protein AYK26_00340 [Euryarchaeota archaeon SM23-78]|nr:MAG: hypothetical protein AYK26_00340 [Euryarchaeota archaeon SM23-78]MBW3000892.1 hypothetical protein [Candidatus Woesearchaeota archaeon]
MVKIRVALLLFGLLVVFLLLAVGCGKTVVVEDNVSANQSENVSDVELEKPECPPCEEPECPKCPVCDEECSHEPIEVFLDNVKILQKDIGGSEQRFNFYYVNDEYDRLESASLLFTPKCDSSDTEIFVDVGGREIFNNNPVCNEQNKVPIDAGFLVFGRNTFTMRSIVNKSYMVSDINLESFYSDNTSNNKSFLDIEFLPVDPDKEITLKSFSDASIMNYQEYQVRLDKRDLVQDLTFYFDADANGLIVVLVNDKEMYTGGVKKKRNRIVIPKEELIEGENIIVVIGVPE